MKPAAALAAAVALVAGCGGDAKTTPTGPLTHDQYEEIVSGLAQEAGDRLRESAGILEGITAEDVRKTSLELRALADEVAALEAPRDVLHAHRELIEGLRGFATEFPEAMERIGYSKNPDTVLAALAQLPSFKLLQHAQLEFRRFGYDIELA